MTSGPASATVAESAARSRLGARLAPTSGARIGAAEGLFCAVTVPDAQRWCVGPVAVFAVGAVYRLAHDAERLAAYAAGR